MIAIPAYAPRAAAKLLVALVCVLLAAVPARAQGKLKAHYTISMTGVTIGEIVWLVEIGDTLYTTSATGNASGVLSMLVNGEGSVAAQGNIAADRLNPSSYTSTITDDDGTIKLQLTFADGDATEQITPQPPVRADRVPVTDADRRGIAEPLSAGARTGRCPITAWTKSRSRAAIPDRSWFAASFCNRSRATVPTA